MLRVVFYLLLAIFLISVIRAVVGAIARAFAEFASPSRPRPSDTASAANEVPVTGELKKDPVCGTYTAAATSIKQSFGSQTLYFCSPQCRDKYVATH